MKHFLPFKPNLERLNYHLKQIVKERNFETNLQSLNEIQSYIKEEFLSYGFGVQEISFLFQGQTFYNVVARLSSNSTHPRLIIGAHFDAVPASPGADDDASGIACLLEAARIYAESTIQESPSIKPQIDVEFVAFNLEEYGMIGSRAYVQKLKTEGVRVAGMLSLEMVGYISQEKDSQKMPFFLKPFYPDVGNFIGLVANTRSKKLLEKVKRIFRKVEDLPVESLVLPANGWIFPEARLSDHAPFWDEGFPALLITDTSFYRNPYYHSLEDRVETLDLNFLAKVTEATIRTALFHV